MTKGMVWSEHSATLISGWKSPKPFIYEGDIKTAFSHSQARNRLKKVDRLQSSAPGL